MPQPLDYEPHDERRGAQISSRRSAVWLAGGAVGIVFAAAAVARLPYMSDGGTALMTSMVLVAFLMLVIAGIQFIRSIFE